MNKKLFTQIRNEWRSNLWLVVELLLVSVVLWWIVDYMYVMNSIYHQPKGFDISHCYLVKMGKLTPKSPDYIPDQTAEQQQEDVKELMQRLSRRDDVEAASLSQSSYPYNGSNGSYTLLYDTLYTQGWVICRMVTPDFVKVFRYHGTRGETPEQLAEIIEKGELLVSDNLYDNSWQQTGIRATSLVGKTFFLGGDTTNAIRLGAALEPVRYGDYYQTRHSISMMYKLSPSQIEESKELCVRVLPEADKGFIERLKADGDKLYRVGNVFIADIISFDEIRKVFQRAETNDWRNYTVGMSFLMLNIFLGLLGTFWFRTQQRRSEIALMKALGGTKRSVFVRLISEGLILLVIATIPALIVDWNLTYAELVSSLDGKFFAPLRFLITAGVSFALIALMIVVGIWIPARRAMKIQPAEALHDE